MMKNTLKDKAKQIEDNHHLKPPTNLHIESMFSALSDDKKYEGLNQNSTNFDMMSSRSKLSNTNDNDIVKEE